jgi:hypothetical protein
VNALCCALQTCARECPPPLSSALLRSTPRVEGPPIPTRSSPDAKKDIGAREGFFMVFLELFN